MWEKPGALAIATQIEDVEIAAQRCPEAKSDFVSFMEHGLRSDPPPTAFSPLLETDLEDILRSLGRSILRQRVQWARARQARNDAYSPKSLHGS
jgi:hypothetical protein